MASTTENTAPRSALTSKSGIPFGGMQDADGALTVVRAEQFCGDSAFDTLQGQLRRLVRDRRQVFGTGGRSTFERHAQHRQPLDKVG